MPRLAHGLAQQVRDGPVLVDVSEEGLFALLDGEGAEFVGLTGCFEDLTAVGLGGDGEEVLVGGGCEAVAELESSFLGIIRVTIAGVGY